MKEIYEKLIELAKEFDKNKECDNLDCNICPMNKQIFGEITLCSLLDNTILKQCSNGEYLK